MSSHERKLKYLLSEFEKYDRAWICIWTPLCSCKDILLNACLVTFQKSVNKIPRLSVSSCLGVKMAAIFIGCLVMYRTSVALFNVTSVFYLFIYFQMRSFVYIFHSLELSFHLTTSCWYFIFIMLGISNILWVSSTSASWVSFSAQKSQMVLWTFFSFQAM